MINLTQEELDLIVKDLIKSLQKYKYCSNSDYYLDVNEFDFREVARRDPSFKLLVKLIKSGYKPQTN
jgi:hypothetical protein